MTESELRIYLPRYLSEESFAELLKGLKQFPENIDDRLYTDFLANQQNIFQGDCLSGLLVVNVQNLERKTVPAIVLSNTCDIDPSNNRLFSSSIVFAPLVKMEVYMRMLESEKIEKQKIESHIQAIKNQSLTQILFLLSHGEKLNESIVFLDKIFNIPSQMFSLSELLMQRIVTLSDYGSYLFLFKLSLHFTRIQDKVERKSLGFN